MPTVTNGNLPTVVMRPPYEISETGWGEFEVVIKLFFADSAEKPVSLVYFNPLVASNVSHLHTQITIYHLIKLFQSDPAIMAGKKNLVSETYDELVSMTPLDSI